MNSHPCFLDDPQTVRNGLICQYGYGTRQQAQDRFDGLDGGSQHEQAGSIVWWIRANVRKVLIERYENSPVPSTVVVDSGVRRPAKAFIMHGVYIVLMGAQQVGCSLWEVLIDFEPHGRSGRHVDDAFARQGGSIGQRCLNRFVCQRGVLS